MPASGPLHFLVSLYLECSSPKYPHSSFSYHFNFFSYPYPNPNPNPITLWAFNEDTRRMVWLVILFLNITKNCAKICLISADTRVQQLPKYNCSEHYKYFCNTVFHFKMVKCLVIQDIIVSNWIFFSVGFHYIRELEIGILKFP